MHDKQFCMTDTYNKIQLLNTKFNTIQYNQYIYFIKYQMY